MKKIKITQAKKQTKKKIIKKLKFKKKKPIKKVKKPSSKRMKLKKKIVKNIKKKPKKQVKKAVRKKTIRRPDKKIKKKRTKPKKTIRKPKKAQKRLKKNAKKPIKMKRRLTKSKKTTKQSKKKTRGKSIGRTKRKIKKKGIKKKITRKKKIGKTNKRITGSPLEQLFESSVKIQIMKLFFRNSEENFLLKDVTKRLRVNQIKINREIKKLAKAGFLRSKKVSSRKQLFSINSNFDFFNELRGLILKSAPVSKEKILKTVKRLGRIKLVLLSGIFVGNETSQADLLIVGDNINQREINNFIKSLESEAGAEIKCAVMNVEEFNYRYNMYDRFIKDLLSEKNEILINKFGL